MVETDDGRLWPKVSGHDSIATACAFPDGSLLSLSPECKNKIKNNLFMNRGLCVEFRFLSLMIGRVPN